MKNLPINKKLILFDGVCNLCNASVLFIIKRDKKAIFMFAPLQSNIGQQISEIYSINSKIPDSILLFEHEKWVTHKSTAAIKIASKLGFPYNLLLLFYVIPPFIRNWVYDYIAKNRYKWYGKRDECMIPTPELQVKFLE